MKRILRLSAVEDRTGLKHTAIYAWMAEGRFPRSVSLGNKAVGWLEDEIDAWIAARKAERDATALTKAEAEV